jgi:two-component system cell cycle response regulator/two-component system cell cycle response regulator DivK
MKEKILIVEDNPRNMRLLKVTLRAKDYTLLEATDGGEALDMAIREQPDLIIMDIQLPKVTGLAVTRRLREIPEFRHIPIIAITAYAMKGDREQVIRAGCDAYLPKPINTRELPGMIAAMLLHRQRDSTPAALEQQCERKS